MNFIFLGPPGAGKGTLATEISKRYQIPHISTGQIFREAIKNQTELGKQVKAVMDSGALVSDSLTIALVRERLSEPDIKEGFILDGFPRTIPQAEALEAITKIDHAVNFVISTDKILERLTGRRVCSSCGRNYHVLFAQPKVADCCDACGEKLIIREDDKKEAILKRLEAYDKQTKPLISFYEKKNVLANIDAEPQVDEVLQLFQKAFPR
ncbi:adenylate kinase [Treponema phagedenis]|uniref:Adenylate kinase n=1 Tax=Treponema phagedenis TaxID=162 RepID=A0A0B7GTS1_TREPH|nr:adenylate kinase [Treponema phagedenis]NVP22774.1 adenylate kinase [Treponema phagedenis]QEJ95272.1 adenylate kinase [Treponema phagedenis]QEJ98376.1 adenylate kinase [Treponema phagedenis]QEK01125.1 adenylate kinase [Treponema phagedenis]QEK03885.1 adenylate kinase [Treponema phagedenis]